MSATLVALAGCSNESPGQASGTTTPAPTSKGTPATSNSGSTDSSATGEAPTINEPELDLSKFSGSECELLKSDQLSSFGISKAGTPDQGTTGAQCEYKADDRVRGLNFTLSTLEKINGLDGIYQKKDSYPVFRPGEVTGYPSVNFDGTNASQGDCSTAVGTAKGAGFMIQVNLHDRSSAEYTSPCNVSSQIAGLVVSNLKGGR